MATTPDGPAASLNELYLTLKLEPLVSKEELDRFYRGEVNAIRGEDTVARLSLKLQQAYEAIPFKAFVMGHQGVGKSTELSRLLDRVKSQHRGIRLSVAEELNPASFKIFDIVLLMMIRITAETNSACPEVLQRLVSQSLFDQIQQWFDTETHKKETKRTVAGSIEAGAGAKGGSLLGNLLGVFASAKGEIKYAADRSSEVVEYQLKRLPDLVTICNRLVDLCSRALKQAEGKEWLLIIEDLDKTGISPQQLQELFIQYGTVFQDLRANLIFTIPVWLAYSSEANRLPFERHLIPDTPVFDKQHDPHELGRAAIQAVLEARMLPRLFAPNQMTKLVIASGGNIRDLFQLVLDAGDSAILRNPESTCIHEPDSVAAINSMRRDYRRKLGQSPYDPESIGYEEKLKKLLAVYSRDPNSEIPDPTLYSLLRARAIQEFNGDGWFGVHPVVVDILKEQGHLKPQDQGGTE